MLGDSLITAPVRDNEAKLPSPNELRNRIILKNKKIRRLNPLGSGSIVGAAAAAPHQRHSTAVPPSFLQARYEKLPTDGTVHKLKLIFYLIYWQKYAISDVTQEIA